MISVMAIRPILHYPDKRLRVKAAAVERFDAALNHMGDDMAETKYAPPGVGLAAPQIGEPLRLFIVDVRSGDDDAPSELRVFINPEIVEKTGAVQYEEGCLSFPGVHEEVDRAERVRVRAVDVTGTAFELEADGLLAIAIQHEHDHLEGKLLVDHLSLLRRRLVHRAMVKRAGEDGRAA